MDLTLPGGPTVPITTWAPALLALIVVGWVVLAERRRRLGTARSLDRIRDLERTVARQRTSLEETERRQDAGRERFESAQHTLTQATAAVRDLSAARDPETFLSALSRHVTRLLAPEQWMILTAVGDDSGAFEMAASGAASGDEVWPVGRRLDAGAGRIGVLATRGPALDQAAFDELPEAVRNRALDSEPEAFRIDAAVQIVVRDQLRAVLAVGGTDPTLPSPRPVLEFLAEVAAGALEHVDAERRRREAERRDEITGLWNKPYFSAQASEICYQNRTRGVWTTVVLVGVDDFRAFLVANGHVAGDRLLRSVATHVHDVFAGTGMSCRWANDEFLVCVPEARPAVVRTATEALLDAVRTADWNRGAGVVPVTVSAGVAATRDEACSFDDAVETATQHMTSARWAGGDQTVGVEDDDPELDEAESGPIAEAATPSPAPGPDPRP